MQNDWPFTDAPNTYAFTSAAILAGAPILRVHHDDDGTWQFHDGSDVTMADARVVSLFHAVSRDVSTRELVDLPCGWVATREDTSKPWVRMLTMSRE